MTTDDKIREEKAKYNINRKAAKTSASLSDKIDQWNSCRRKKDYHLIEVK